jgi:hypothetical protein
MNEIELEKRRIWKMNNPDKVRAGAKRHRETHRGEWLLNNPEKAKLAKRKSNLKNSYGMSIADWDALYNSQGGKCRLCGVGSNKLVVDHNHRTGKVRALLCQNCNLSLGKFGDDVPGLEKAITYLKETDPQ